MADPESERASVALAELSWTEVEAALSDGVDTVILPLGATEQHGPHLPLETDTVLAEAIGRRVARRLGGTLVAPPVPVGPSEEHAGFPGTISISAETLWPLLMEYVTSFEHHGFDRAVILPTHGSCFPVVDAAYPELVGETDVDVVAITDREWYMGLLIEGLEAAGIDPDTRVVHAGATETAMMLAVAPESVAESLPAGYDGNISAVTLFTEGIEAYAPNGVLGDARPATAEIGETILDYVVSAFSAYVREEFRDLADSRGASSPE